MNRFLSSQSTPVLLAILLGITCLSETGLAGEGGGSDGGTNVIRGSMTLTDFQTQTEGIPIDPTTFEGIYPELAPLFSELDEKIPYLGTDLQKALSDSTESTPWLITPSTSTTSAEQATPVRIQFVLNRVLKLRADQAAKASREELKRTWVTAAVQFWLDKRGPFGNDKLPPLARELAAAITEKIQTPAPELSATLNQILKKYSNPEHPVQLVDRVTANALIRKTRLKEIYKELCPPPSKRLSQDDWLRRYRKAFYLLAGKRPSAGKLHEPFASWTARSIHGKTLPKVLNNSKVFGELENLVYDLSVNFLGYFSGTSPDADRSQWFNQWYKFRQWYNSQQEGHPKTLTLKANQICGMYSDQALNMVFERDNPASTNPQPTPNLSSGDTTSSSSTEPVLPRTVGLPTQINPRSYLGIYGSLKPLFEKIDRTFPRFSVELEKVFDDHTWVLTQQEFAPRARGEEQPIHQTQTHVYLTASKLAKMSPLQLKQAWLHEAVRAWIHVAEEASKYHGLKPWSKTEREDNIEKATAVLWDKADWPPIGLSVAMFNVFGIGELFLSQTELSNLVQSTRLKERFQLLCPEDPDSVKPDEWRRRWNDAHGLLPSADINVAEKANFLYESLGPLGRRIRFPVVNGRRQLDEIFAFQENTDSDLYPKTGKWDPSKPRGYPAACRQISKETAHMIVNPGSALPGKAGIGMPDTIAEAIRRLEERRPSVPPKASISQKTKPKREIPGGAEKASVKSPDTVAPSAK